MEGGREMGVGNVAAAATTTMTMTMTMTMHVTESSASKTMELKWVRTPKSQNYIDRLGMLSKTKPPPLSQASVPIFISTNASHVNPDELAQVYSSCNFSCHRFPKYVVSDSGTPVVELVDVHKLRVALCHSSVLVSVFCKPDDAVADSSSSMGLGNFFERLVMPVGPNNGQLVGFGRAVSDQGLTASIYDVMVIPSLRRLGIGRIIVRRIIRMLTSRDIYDIAAVCSESERPFFEACGFGNDILGSTAMMYTRSVSTDSEGNQMVKRAGRKLLLVPPLKKTFQGSKHLRL